MATLCRYNYTLCVVNNITFYAAAAAKKWNEKPTSHGFYASSIHEKFSTYMTYQHLRNLGVNILYQVYYLVRWSKEHF